MGENLSTDSIYEALDKLFCLTEGMPFSPAELSLSKLRSFAQFAFDTYTSDREQLEELLGGVVRQSLGLPRVLFFEPSGAVYYWFKQFADRFTRQPRYDLSSHPLVVDLSQTESFLEAFQSIGGMINGRKRLIADKLPLPKDQHEVFVDILSEAGILVVAGPNEHGVKGMVWNINQQLLDLVQTHIDHVPFEIKRAP